VADLTGKTCLILSAETILSRSVHDNLVASGANVSMLDIPEATEPAWDSGLLNSQQRPAKIDAIINVSIPDSGGAVGDVALPEFRRVIETSYIRTWLALKYGIQTLRSSGGGSFITITSVDGATGVPAAAARCAASHGITLMTKSAALECADKKDNVRVNALLVGDIIPGEHEAYASGHVSPEDVAEAAAHLVSDAAVYITGLIMPVDNGRVGY